MELEMKYTLLKLWILSVLLLIVLPTVATSQSFYSSINPGYGFRISGTNNFGTMFINKMKDEKGIYMESVDFSLGEGMNFGIDFGYKISDNIAAEIGLSYMKGEKVQRLYNFDEFVPREMAIAGEMYRITPSIVISVGEGVFVPYVKLGVAFGIGTMEFSQSMNDYVTIVKLSGGTPIGITGALGIDLKIHEQISCFVQASSVNMSYFPEEGEMIKRLENGKDVLSKLTYREKNFKLVKKLYSESEDPNPDPNKAREILWMPFPFDSFGFNLGVKFRF
jgi:outer membrane protein W